MNRSILLCVLAACEASAPSPSPAQPTPVAYAPVARDVAIVDAVTATPADAQAASRSDEKNSGDVLGR